MSLEFSNDGKRFIPICENLYLSAGDVLVHNGSAVFCTLSESGDHFGKVSVFVVTATSKPINMAPLVKAKWMEMPLSKTVDLGTGYIVTSLTGNERGIKLVLGRTKFDSETLNPIAIEIPWADVESFLKQPAGHTSKVNASGA